MGKNVVKEMVKYLRDKGVNVTYDDNPSKEKVERINSRIIELRKKYNYE